jgi:4'-phosphopantetheinyl transferase
MNLDPDEVHIWRASLDQPREVIERLSHLLSADERERVARYLTDRNRIRFIAGRAIQRDVLARYANVPAADLAFAYSPAGKPRLVGTAAAASVTFNASSSGAFAVYAIARGRAIGVDIEELRGVDESISIADFLFATDEIAAVKAADSAERPSVFLEYWTRFEARVKALDLGVGDRLERGHVLFSCALDVGSAHVGAFAVEASAQPPIRYFDWTATSHGSSFRRSM